MRRQDKAWDEDSARGLLQSAATLTLAGTGANGQPLLRVVHPICWGDRLFLHSAPAGEKLELLGRPVVVSTYEVIAEVPSWAFHPERACPATTLYRSAQGRGVLRQLTDPAEKAAVLQSLMERFQPNGGHRPITHDDALYRRAVSGVAILELAELEVTGKAALGQRYAPAGRLAVLEALWRAGAPGAPAAIEVVRAASPHDPTPPFLHGPCQATLCVAPSRSQARQAASLLTTAYWNAGTSAVTIAAAHRASPAWVTATVQGELVGTARAITDGAKLAYVMDVMVAAAWRRRGLGRRLVQLLLDHPAVRHADRVTLHTRDAEDLYRRLGFVRREQGDQRLEMVLQRRGGAPDTSTYRATTPPGGSTS